MYKTVQKEIGNRIKVLDIGFGNGYMLKKLLKITDSIFYGIDISQDMVDFAFMKNFKYHKNGRLKLTKASVESIPFEEKFYQIYTINTVYFWSDLKSGLAEIYNKLEDHGEFINVCYTKQWLDRLGYTKSYKKYSEQELLKAYESVGFKAEIKTIKSGKSFYIKATKVSD